MPSLRRGWVPWTTPGRWQQAMLGPFGSSLAESAESHKDLLFSDLKATGRSGEAGGGSPSGRAPGGTGEHKPSRRRDETQVHTPTPGDQERDLILCGVIKLSSWDDLG